MHVETIGIFGQGFVGTAVKEGLKDHFDVMTYDKFRSDLSSSTAHSIARSCDIVFVCVPTPMNSDGSCNIDIVTSVIDEIDSLAALRTKQNKLIAVIKSTVPPGTTEMLDDRSKNIDVAFVPEFLTEANSINDFKNPTRIIIGARRPASSVVKALFQKVFPKVPIIKTGSKTAETVKYMTNCFLATKVSFANEMYQVCEKLDIDYDKVVEYAKYDSRLGSSHWSVPGPVSVDGELISGFGGHCLAKDINCMINLAEQLDVEPLVMSAVWKKNLEVRPPKYRDWETMKGRAVTHDYEADDEES